MPGTLIPPWYIKDDISAFEHKVVTLTWGIQLGLGWLAGVKAARQTLKKWRRSRRITGYVVMIWTEWIASMTMGILCWLFVDGTLQPSLEYYLFIVTIWSIQIHIILQIIINRLAIVIADQKIAQRLKWFTAGIILVINISVFCVWIPSRLQISPQWIYANKIWDRMEKCLFLILDAGLNIYFIISVKQNLISRGLTKYTPLFGFNLFMIGVSIFVDILILSVMNLRNDYISIQFQALAYIIKLHIEMDMAALITKLARGPHRYGDHDNSHFISTNLGTTTRGRPSAGPQLHVQPGLIQSHSVNTLTTEIGRGTDDIPFCDQGITKTVVTRVEFQSQGECDIGHDTLSAPSSRNGEDLELSSRSSTRELIHAT